MFCPLLDTILAPVHGPYEKKMYIEMHDAGHLILTETGWFR